MRKSKIVKTTDNTGFRISECNDQIVVIEGVKLIYQRRSNDTKAIVTKEVQFGCFEDSTIDRFNSIKIITRPSTNKNSRIISCFLRVLRSRRKLKIRL